MIEMGPTKYHPCWFCTLVYTYGLIYGIIIHIIYGIFIFHIFSYKCILLYIIHISMHIYRLVYGVLHCIYVLLCISLYSLHIEYSCSVDQEVYNDV